MLSPPEPSVWSGNIQVSYDGILALAAPVKQLQTSTFKELSDDIFEQKRTVDLKGSAGTAMSLIFARWEVWKRDKDDVKYLSR